MKKYLIFLAFLCAIGCSEKHRVVSIISLLATPERYDGELVIVNAYFVQQKENVALYLTSEHAKAHISESGIWLSTTERTSIRENSKSGFVYHKSPVVFSGEYIMVSGRFKAGHGGHMGSFAGTIEDVTLMHKQGF